MSENYDPDTPPPPPQDVQPPMPPNTGTDTSTVDAPGPRNGPPAPRRRSAEPRWQAPATSPAPPAPGPVWRNPAPGPGLQHPPQGSPWEAPTFWATGSRQSSNGATNMAFDNVQSALTIENVLKWSGLALVSFAAIFLVSTAITRGWLGPELQLAGAGLIGFSFYGFAARSHRHRPGWTSAFNHAGATVTIVCAAVAHDWLGLVGLPTRFALVTAATAIALSVSIALRTPLAAATATTAALGAAFPIVDKISLQLNLLWVIVVLFAGLLPSLLRLALGTQALGTQAFGTLGLDNKGDARESTLWQAQRILTGVAAALTFPLVVFAYVPERFPNYLPAESPILVHGIIAVAVVTALLWLAPAAAHWILRSTPISDSSSAQRLTAWEHRLMLGLPSGAAWNAAVFVTPDFGNYLAPSIAGAFALLALLSRRALPRSLFLAHLVGASILASTAAIDLLDGPTLLVALAAQGLGATYFGGHLNSSMLRINGIALSSIATLAAIGLALATLVEADPSNSWRDLPAALVVAAAGLGVSFLCRNFYGYRFSEYLNGLHWAIIPTIAVAFAAQHLREDELLLAVTAGSALSLLAAPALGRAVGTVGLAIAGVCVLIAQTTFAMAVVEGASLLGHAANASLVVLAIGLSVGLGIRKHSTAPPATVAAWVCAMAWLATALIHLPQGQLLLSAVWALAGSAAAVVGVATADRMHQLLGMGTIGVVLVKLFSVDLAAIDTFWRAGLFFVLGAGFLVLGYRIPKLSQPSGGSPDSAETSINVEQERTSAEPPLEDIPLT